LYEINDLEYNSKLSASEACSLAARAAAELTSYRNILLATARGKLLPLAYTNYM
jgi:hypothetical protein